MSKTANWNYPTSVRFGAGRIKELPALCQSLGMQRPLLVTDRGLGTAPITTATLALLQDAGLGAAIFSDLKPNPVGANLDTRLFPRIMSTAPVRATAKRLIAARLPRPLWRRLFFPHGAPRPVLDTFFDEYRTCEAFGQMFEIITPAWFRQLPPVTGVPAVVVWGEHDRVLRSGQADVILDKVPGAEVIVQPGWDHFPMIEQPQEYADVITAIARRLVASDPSS